MYNMYLYMIDAHHTLNVYDFLLTWMIMKMSLDGWK